MLIITRKIGQSVILDHDIKIIILDNTPGNVKLGFEAPDDVEIWREEIYDQIEEE